MAQVVCKSCSEADQKWSDVKAICRTPGSEIIWPLCESHWPYAMIAGWQPIAIDTDAGKKLLSEIAS